MIFFTCNIVFCPVFFEEYFELGGNLMLLYTLYVLLHSLFKDYICITSKLYWV